MAAIYQTDVWCNDCAELIRDDIRSHGKAPIDPDDETSYDSDEFPKQAGDDEESDSPQHCAAGADCENAVRLSDGTKVGLLFGSLTDAGIDYVREAIDEDGEVAELWKTHFNDEGYDF